tara:strand:- start:529 stop:843 length:315 start_codon:yes stop_codon:yes gene_type:complete
MFEYEKWDSDLWEEWNDEFTSTLKISSNKELYNILCSAKIINVTEEEERWGILHSKGYMITKTYELRFNSLHFEFEIKDHYQCGCCTDWSFNILNITLIKTILT